MSDTARDIQTFEPASTSGLGELFESVQDAVHDLSETVQDAVHDSATSVHDYSTHPITVVQAAKLLGVDRRSVVRLINWGKLQASKDSRGKWLIDRDSVLERIAAQGSVQPEGPGLVQDGVLVEELLVQDAVLDEMPTSQAVVQDSVHDSLLEILQQQSSQLTQAYTYLDAATARVLYLQQQLEEKEQQIKLLTDSQHKVTWWRRFKAFFVKQ